MKSTFLASILFCILLCSCTDECCTQAEWQDRVCSAFEAEDHVALKSTLNDYLINQKKESTENLIQSLNIWLDEFTCIKSEVDCIDCIQSFPPKSILKISSENNGNSILLDLVLISFSEAGEIRVFEVQ